LRAIWAEQADYFSAFNVQRHVMQDRPPVIALGNRAHFQPAHRRAGWAGLGLERRRLVHCGRLLRWGTVKRPVTRPPPPWLMPRRPPSNHRTSGVEIYRQPSAAEKRTAALKPDIADQGDQALGRGRKRRNPPVAVFTRTDHRHPRRWHQSG
jgi:hypothetical protein